MRISGFLFFTFAFLFNEISARRSTIDGDNNLGICFSLLRCHFSLLSSWLRSALLIASQLGSP